MSSRLPGAPAKKKRWKKRPKPYNAPKPEDLEMVLGKWKVTKVLYESSCDDDGELDRLEDGGKGVYLSSECEGVEVTFDEQCDITWSIPTKVELIPLFLTTSFNIEKDMVDMIGGEDGKTFRFLIERCEDASGLALDENRLILKTPIDDSYEEEGTAEMIITIEKVPSMTVIVDQFSLKDALDDTYFSDLTINSSDGASFPVHRVILASSSQQISYREWQVILAGFKAPLVKVILEYIYSDCLSPTITLSQAKELCTALSAHPKLSRLRDACKAYIESNNLKQRLMGLVDDLQSALELAKDIVQNTEMANPIKVTYAVKLLAKEAAAGAAKLGLLCELYTRNKKEMSKKEKHEVLEYVRGRVVVFVDLLNELIEVAITKFNHLTDGQKTEIATYIIPEVERIWDMINVTCKEMESAMIAKVKSLHTKGGPHFRRQDIKVAFILQFIARGRELKRLQKIGKEFEDFVMHSHRKREEFREWTESEKAEKIVRVMDGLEVEGVNQMDQLTDLKKDILMDNVLDWKKFKMMVTVICSYMSWGLRKAQAFKTPLKPVLLKGLKFIQRSEVNDILMYFDLLDEADIKELLEDDQDREDMKTVIPGLHGRTVLSENMLSQGCHKLLASQDYSDMKFILSPHTPPLPTLGEEGATPQTPSISTLGEEGSTPQTPSLPTLNSAEDAESAGSGSGEGVVIPAHRVIVAARCEYFKRALQSGMWKEAIDRCIVIHECEESLFRLFLHYLYGGTLDTSTMTIEDIVELMAVADRYETVSLRGMCEGLLVERVEDSCVFALLQVADHYSARRLREVAFEHILADPDVLMREVEAYSNLPDDLKDEIRKITSSINPHLAVRHSKPIPSETPHVNSADNFSSSSGSSSSGDYPSIPPLSQSAEAGLALEAGVAMENFEEAYSSSVLAFQQALSELRAIVGDEPSDHALKDVLLAADLDINRALNYYFSVR